jgi:hypothetical protein
MLTAHVVVDASCCSCWIYTDGCDAAIGEVGDTDVDTELIIDVVEAVMMLRVVNVGLMMLT